MTFEVVAGPDAGRRCVFAAGRHLVGRARHCSLVLDDPAVEAHHLLLDVSGDGSVGVTQLTGRVPVRCDAGLEVGDSLIQWDGDRWRDAAPTAGGFECAVRRASLAAWDRHVAAIRRSRWAVTLGVGTVRSPVALDVEPAALPLELQAAYERAEVLAGVRVLVDLARSDREIVAIVDLAGTRCGHAVVRSIRRQLASAGASTPDADRTLVVTHDPRIRVAGDEQATVLVLLEGQTPVPEACTAVLELGARWRARWIPDTGHPDDVVRLHAAGRSLRTDSPSPVEPDVPTLVTSV